MQVYPRAVLVEICADEPAMLRSTMQAARLRTLSRAAPARLGVLPAVQHGARELCTGLPKEGEEGCGAVTPLPPWRHRNKPPHVTRAVVLYVPEAQGSLSRGVACCTYVSTRTSSGLCL